MILWAFWNATLKVNLCKSFEKLNVAIYNLRERWLCFTQRMEKVWFSDVTDKNSPPVPCDNPKQVFLLSFTEAVKEQCLLWDELYLGFRTGVLEEMDFTEVVSHRHHLLIVRATQSVDVCAVRALQPHTWRTTATQSTSSFSLPGTNVWKLEFLFLTHDVEAQHAGVGRPFSVFALKAIPQQFTACSDVPCQNTPISSQISR